MVDRTIPDGAPAEMQRWVCDHVALRMRAAIDQCRMDVRLMQITTGETFTGWLVDVLGDIDRRLLALRSRPAARSIGGVHRYCFGPEGEVMPLDTEADVATVAQHLRVAGVAAANVYEVPAWPSDTNPHAFKDERPTGQCVLADGSIWPPR
jgi:hypothetical protein